MYKMVNSSNYKIVADQAYTEDNILIYNIFTKNIPKDATKQEISKYFRQFGKVLDVRMIGKNNGRKCFIDFEDSKVAAKVLKQTNHFMNKTLKLQACGSYYQPDGLKIIAQLKENYKNDCLTEEATATNSCCNNTSIKPEQNALILNLNDDCLEHICKQLPPKDQINFALTCQRFCDTFKMISSVEYLTLSTDTFIHWTPWQARIFLQLVGPQIKTLIVDFIVMDNDSRWKMTTYIKFLSLFCINVENLLVFSSDVPSSLMRLLFENMTQLKELELCSTTDNMIKYLKRFKNLKSLRITNSDITGKSINLLTGLEKLSLNECYNLSSCHFKRICQCLRNLQYLDIRSCEQFVTDDFQQIFENLLELKSLKVTTTAANFNCLAQLPKLTHLELHNSCHSTPEEFFRLLAKHQAEQLVELKMENTVRLHFDVSTSLAELKKLKILHCDNHAIDDEGLKKISQLKELEDICCMNCENISDKSALEVLKNCLKLKRLHLIGCNNIKPEFITNCIKLLKEQKERWLRSDRVIIQLSETGPLRAKLDTIPKEDYADILNISLDKVLGQFFDFDDSEYDDDEIFNGDDSDDDYYNYFGYHYSDDNSDDDYYDHNFLENILFHLGRQLH